MRSLEQPKKKPLKIWTFQIQAILRKRKMEFLWEKQCPVLISEHWKSLMGELYSISLNEDHQRLEKSTSSRLLELKTLPGAENYLFSSPEKQRRVWSQLRLASTRFPFAIGLNNLRQILDPRKDCEVCRLHSAETLDHFLFVCPLYEVNRRSLLYCHLQNPLQAAQTSTAVATTAAAPPYSHTGQTSPTSHSRSPTSTDSPTSPNIQRTFSTPINTSLSEILSTSDASTISDVFNYVIS